MLKLICSENSVLSVTILRSCFSIINFDLVVLNKKYLTFCFKDVMTMINKIKTFSV